MFKKALILTTLTLLSVGCQKKNAQDDEFDSHAFIAESAAAIVSDSASTSEGNTSSNSNFQAGVAHAPGSGSCPNFLYPTLSCTGDQNNISQLKYDSQGDGSGSACHIGPWLLFGTQTQTFDSQATCQNFNPLSNWPAQGSSINRTLQNFKRHSVITGRSLVTSTDGVADYTGASHNGGIAVTFGALRGDREIQIHGVNRKLMGRAGRVLFDHTIYTDSPVQVSGTLANADRVVSGTVNVAHNLARYTAQVSFQNLRWGSSQCCHPTSGSINAQFSGSVNGRVVVDYSNACGQVRVTDVNNDQYDVSLNSCE